MRPLIDRLVGFPFRLKTVMRARHIQARELARLSGLNVQFLYRLLRGDAQPGFETACKIAEALHCRLGDLRDPPEAYTCLDCRRPINEPDKRPDQAALDLADLVEPDNMSDDYVDWLRSSDLSPAAARAMSSVIPAGPARSSTSSAAPAAATSPAKPPARSSGSSAAPARSSTSSAAPAAATSPAAAPARSSGSSAAPARSSTSSTSSAAPARSSTSSTSSTKKPPAEFAALADKIRKPARSIKKRGKR